MTFCVSMTHTCLINVKTVIKYFFTSHRPPSLVIKRGAVLKKGTSRVFIYLLGGHVKPADLLKKFSGLGHMNHFLYELPCFPCNFEYFFTPFEMATINIKN